MKNAPNTWEKCPHCDEQVQETFDRRRPLRRLAGEWYHESCFFAQLRRQAKATAEMYRRGPFGVALHLAIHAPGADWVAEWRRIEARVQRTRRRRAEAQRRYRAAIRKPVPVTLPAREWPAAA